MSIPDLRWYVTRLVSLALSELLHTSHDMIVASNEPNLVLVLTHYKWFNVDTNQGGL